MIVLHHNPIAPYKFIALLVVAYIGVASLGNLLGYGGETTTYEQMVTAYNTQGCGGDCTY